MGAEYGEGLALMWLLGSAFLVILGIFWTLVPFAIFGIKPLLRDQIYQQQRTNALLAELISGMRDGTWPELRK